MNEVGDVEKLLLETLKPSLVELSKKGIGSYSVEKNEGIYYIFDGAEYLIRVSKIG